MRILLVAMLLGLGAAGCGDDTTSTTQVDDMHVFPDMATHGDLAIANCGDAGTNY